ncbi:MAG: DUF1015 domain-containing protein [Bacteroidetes bacterium]|nr:DUF1015 domain-containing protein [Bacteroidota bacterium]
MSIIKPFKALRPQAQFAKQVASRPYDVLSSAEAKIEAQGNPHSFLHITKSEIDLPDNTDPHSKEVYERAKENLDAFLKREILFNENKDCYYLYRLQMNGRSQTGLVCISSLDDYAKGIIKKHEFTRPEKELDRIRHIQTTGAQTGNVFLAYRNVKAIDDLFEKITAVKSPVYDFTADDGIQHTIWIVNDSENIEKITALFSNSVPCTYIADGHHRAASAAKVFEETGTNGQNGAGYFLTTLFPSDQLEIIDYNRIVKSLNGLTEKSFLEKVREKFSVIEKEKAVKPDALHQFGMYLNGKWYLLEALPGTFANDPKSILDVSILQNNILTPLLGIDDPRTNKNIDFVGGIRGLSELEKRVDNGEMVVAFSLYPVSLDQLFSIADHHDVMPPKSTWFEPKLRDGLLTHLINEHQ